MRSLEDPFYPPGMDCVDERAVVSTGIGDPVQVVKKPRCHLIGWQVLSLEAEAPHPELRDSMPLGDLVANASVLHEHSLAESASVSQPSFVGDPLVIRNAGSLSESDEPKIVFAQ